MISLKKLTFLFAAIFLAFGSSMVCADVTDQRTANKPCCSLNTDNLQSQTTTKTDCQKNPSIDVSWTAWLLGDRRSNQFHYLDLLELLFRDEQNSETPPTTYK